MNLQTSFFRRAVAVTVLLAFGICVGTQPALTAQDDVPQAEDDKSFGAVLPEVAPADLSSEAFENLGDNWETWSNETVNIIGDLYEDKELSNAARRELLTQLKGRLAVINAALAGQKYSMIHAELRVLRSRIAPRVELLDAVADVIDARTSTVSVSTDIALRNEIVSANVALKNFLATVRNGDKWVQFLELDALGNAMQSAGSPESMTALKATRSQLGDGLGEASGEQKQFAGRFQFQRLADAIDAYVGSKESADKFFVEQVTSLVEAIEAFEQASRRQDAYRIRRGTDLIKSLAPGASSRLGSMVQQRYMSSNLRVGVAESLLNQVISQQRNESGCIADCILGAWVTGTQVSSANVNVNVLPNASMAQLSMSIVGTASTNTQGRKDPATVYTVGNHSYSGSKSVSFDGRRFTSSQTLLNVNTNNRTVGVETDFDWVPILGLFANAIAQKENARKAPQADAIAAQKLANQLVPRFDKEVDGRIAQANSDIESRLFGKLREMNLVPQSISASSSDVHIALATRTMDSSQLAAGTPPPMPIPTSGISMLMHESLVNNALDSLELAGKTLSESELSESIEDKIGEIIGKPFSFGDATAKTATGESRPVLTSTSGQEDADQNEDEPEEDKGSKEATFVFDSIDPLRVKFTDSGFTLILRTGVRQEGEDEIPAQEITIPIVMTREGSKLIFEAGESKIRGLVKISRLKQIATAAQIRRIIKARLPKREVELKPIEVPVEGKPSIMLSITELAVNNGWLSLMAN